jgi:hypothetical protein
MAIQQFRTILLLHLRIKNRTSFFGPFPPCIHVFRIHVSMGRAHLIPALRRFKRSVQLQTFNEHNTLPLHTTLTIPNTNKTPTAYSPHTQMTSSKPCLHPTHQMPQASASFPPRLPSVSPHLQNSIPYAKRPFQFSLPILNSPTVTDTVTTASISSSAGGVGRNPNG